MMQQQKMQMQLTLRVQLQRNQAQVQVLQQLPQTAAAQEAAPVRLMVQGEMEMKRKTMHPK